MATRATDLSIFVEDTGSDLSVLQYAILVFAGVAGAGIGFGAPYFYSRTSDAAELRPNEQPCFACSGTGDIGCRFCEGAGLTQAVLATGEVLERTCANCSGKGQIVCTTCNGTGIQPRYLDRRVWEDDD